MGNRQEEKPEDFIQVQEQELDFTLVYLLQEIQNFDTGQIIPNQPEICCRQIELIQGTT